jgi:hypothetical protein
MTFVLAVKPRAFGAPQVASGLCPLSAAEQMSSRDAMQSDDVTNDSDV